MFWVRNKENNFPIHTLIWRPGPLDGDVNWMSPLQGRSPLVQVKEPYGNLDMVNYLKAFILQPGVHKVHLPIILASEGLAVYRERKKKGQNK